MTPRGAAARLSGIMFIHDRRNGRAHVEYHHTLLPDSRGLPSGSDPWVKRGCDDMRRAGERLSDLAAYGDDGTVAVYAEASSAMPKMQGWGDGAAR